MRMRFYFIIIEMILLLGHNFSLLAQVSPCINITKEVAIQNAVCSDQRIDAAAGEIIKIPLTNLTVSNTLVFSTVGESTDDTFLGLYDASGNLLKSNDDDGDCKGCKQSTISYDLKENSISGAYVIISRPDCKVLDSETKIKFSLRNPYNNEPIIKSPIETIQCVGSSIIFTHEKGIANPWLSDASDVATIDSSTGVANFIKPGIAIILLRGEFNCTIIKNYIVRAIPITSTIFKY